jgi:acylphosphatase
MAQQARAHLIVRGRVQGVCFRMETQKAATVFGVYGWVRNRRDGTVETVIEGNEADVTSLINWCRTGPPLSSVQNVDVTWEKYKGDYDAFRIRY